MADTRPLISIADPDVTRIAQSLVEDLKPRLDTAFDEVLALAGNPAERENDALSLVSTVAAFVGLQLAGRLMERKNIAADRALTVASHDMAARMAAEVGLFMRGRA